MGITPGIESSILDEDVKIGMRFVTFGGDVGFIQDACREAAANSERLRSHR